MQERVSVPLRGLAFGKVPDLIKTLEGMQERVSVPLRGLAFGKVEKGYAAKRDFEVSVPLRGLAFGKASERATEDYGAIRVSVPLRGLAFGKDKLLDDAKLEQKMFQSPCGD